MLFFQKIKELHGPENKSLIQAHHILYVAQLLNTFCNWMFVMDTHRSAPGRPWVSLSCPLEWGPVSSP